MLAAKILTKLAFASPTIADIKADITINTGEKAMTQTLTYKGYELYQAFGTRVAAQTPNGQVLGMFSSLDDAMREIDRRWEKQEETNKKSD